MYMVEKNRDDEMADSFECKMPHGMKSFCTSLYLTCELSGEFWSAHG